MILFWIWEYRIIQWDRIIPPSILIFSSFQSVLDTTAKGHGFLLFKRPCSPGQIPTLLWIRIRNFSRTSARLLSTYMYTTVWKRYANLRSCSRDVPFCSFSDLLKLHGVVEREIWKIEWNRTLVPSSTETLEWKIVGKIFVRYFVGIPHAISAIQFGYFRVKMLLTICLLP